MQALRAWVSRRPSVACVEGDCPAPAAQDDADERRLITDVQRRLAHAEAQLRASLFEQETKDP